MDAVLLALDIDWAPDWAIDFAADLILEAGAAATWFVTHASPAVERLGARTGRFELGIHPNFLPGSTHGADVGEVLEHCLGLVPGARSMRTHGLWQSNALLRDVLERTTIRVDASIFLPRAPHLAPVAFTLGGRTLVRAPVYWGDHYELQQPAPHWDSERLLCSPGLKIFAFHPLHLYLNSATCEAYETLKGRHRHLPRIPRAEAESLVRRGPGPRTLLAALLSVVGRDGAPRLLGELDAGAA